MITDKQKIQVLKKKIRGLRSVLEDEGIDSTSCLMGDLVDERPLTCAENKWILKEYQMGRL